jgi:hypothetical protein
MCYCCRSFLFLCAPFPMRAANTFAPSSCDGQSFVKCKLTCALNEWRIAFLGILRPVHWRESLFLREQCCDAKLALLEFCCLGVIAAAAVFQSLTRPCGLDVDGAREVCSRRLCVLGPRLNACLTSTITIRSIRKWSLCALSYCSHKSIPT